MDKKKILVTGGCGYIGSHTIVNLLDNGFDVVSIDNLSNSNESVLDGIEKITGQRVMNYKIDLSERGATLAFFKENQFDGVIHFAALKHVGESVEQPLRYFQNNLNSLLHVIEGMELSDSNNLIFSSSCSVYGNSTELPVTETTPWQQAESPYARTKQMGENILRDYARVHPAFNISLLRYFNPAGAHSSCYIGESPSNPASNLAPVITETGIGKRSEMTVFGNDYDTRDGSCIRDYIHVMDLAEAHTLALKYLQKGKPEFNCDVFNLGIGEGVSVLEAINAFEDISGQQLNYKIGPRRAGDVIAVYADATKAKKKLGWQPQYDIKAIMQTAWAWEQKRGE